MTDDNRAPVRVRFEVRFRELRVVERISLTPNMLRVVLSGDMEGFQSLGFDDHVKLFLPDPQTGEVILPDLSRPDGPRPLMRDYTPRAFDVAKGLLTIDFALHEPAGPATHWALHSRLGDVLHIGGPRGSTVWSDRFAHYLMIGDETALPAIGRRLEAATANQSFTVLAVVENEAERQDWATQARADVRWLYRTVGQDGLAMIDTLTLPEDTHIWLAGESQWAKTLRAHLYDKGLNPKGIKASGYWQKGKTGEHESLN